MKKKEKIMTEINFTSTYRIPITQAGVNSAKKARLKELIQSYPNGLIGNSKVGNARVSMADSEDAGFIQKLKTIGYKVYQKFEGENIPKEDLDVYIKERLDIRDYSQRGKKMKKLSREMREKRQFERSFDAYPKKNEPAPKDENVVQEVAEKQPVEVKSFSQKPKERTPDEIRQTPNYLKCVEEYGKEFAEAVYFGIY